MFKKSVFIVILAVIFAPQTVSAQDYMAPSSKSATTPPRKVVQTNSNIPSLKKEAMQEFKDAKQQAMQEFRAKIATIQDIKKRTVVTNIDQRISNSNTNLTNKMTNALQKLTQIVERLKVKSETLKAQGVDTSELDTAITASENAIATAETAVDAQVAKTYTANITTDTTLGSVISQMVRQFKSDIQAAFNAVKNAHQQVRNAWTIGAKLSGSTKEATDAAAMPGI